MSLIIHSLYVTLKKNGKQQSQEFNYPFSNAEVNRWLGNDEAVVVDTNLPFRVSMPLNFDKLNTVLDDIDNTSLSKLSVSALREVIETFYGSWQGVDSLETIQVISAVDDADYVKILQDRLGWNKDNFILNQDIMWYVDWNKVASDFMITETVVHADDYYVTH